MKKLLILSLITLSSSSVFARICHVEMVQTRTNRVIDTYIDRDDDCAEAMRECKTQIRLRGLTRGEADCHLRRVSTPAPRPQPNPYPNPQPNPYPGPQTGMDAQRNLRINETVIHNSRRVTVEWFNLTGNVTVRDQFGFQTSTNRQSVAVTSGCSGDLCVNERIIYLTSQKEMIVAGLEYDNQFVLEDNFGFLSSNVNRSDIALTRGCVNVSYYQQVCVGSQVIDRYNRYSTVAGIQIDGRVVLRDNFGFMTRNVDVRDLVVTR